MRRVPALLWILSLLSGLLMLAPDAGQTPISYATVPNSQSWSVTPGTCASQFQGAVFATWNSAVGALNCGDFTSGAPSAVQFDTGQVFPPNVLRDDASVAAPCENGRTSGLCYRMWYVGTRPSDAARRIGYAVSPNGLTWYRVAGNLTGGSVFEGSNIAGRFDQSGTTTFHVLKDGGQYHMWYTGIDGNGRWEGFGYATSTNGVTWQRQNNGQPVLTSRPSLGLFDDDRIIGPFVLIDQASPTAPCAGGQASGRCFRMWYEGFRANNNFYVGHALSPDGINWTIVAGPATLTSVLAGSGGFTDFDSNQVGLAAVIKDGAIYRMWYQAKDFSNPDNFRIGHVTSVDGINWVRPHPNLPAFSGSDDLISVNPPGTSDEVWVVRLLKEDLTYRMWYSTAGTPNSTRVGLVEMTQGAALPATPTFTRSGDIFTLNFTTQVSILAQGSILLTLPPDISLDQFGTANLVGFDGDAVIARERGAVTDAYSGFSARDALIIRLPNGTGAGPKSVSFTLGVGAPNPATVLLQTFDSHKVLERARIVSTDLQVTQSVGAVVAGSPVQYTVVVSNAGPTGVTGAVLNSVFPAQLTGISWTCATSGGASCAPTSGSGNLSGKAVNMPSGSSITFTVNGNLPSTVTGNLNSTVSVTTPSSVNELVAANNSSTRSTSIAIRGDLAISRVSNPAIPLAGQAITYTLSVSNSGPSTVVGASVANTFPISVTINNWVCAASAGSSCPASGSGNISALATLAPGGSAVFTATGSVAANALTMPPHSAVISVPGNVTDPVPGNNVYIDGGGLGRPADLAIAKSSSPAVVVPGLPISYTITITNTGTADADGAMVYDSFPPTITGVSWTCVGAGGAICAQTSGNGDLSLMLTTLPVNGVATITANGIVAAGATGDLVNNAQVVPPVGVDDSDLANNSAQSSNTLQPRTDLSITLAAPPQGIPGGTFSYTLVVRNNGPSAVVGARVIDTPPSVVNITGWACVAASGSQCGAASGNAPIDETIALAPGGMVTYTVTGVIFSNTTGNVPFSGRVMPQEGAVDQVLTDNEAHDAIQVLYAVILPLLMN